MTGAWATLLTRPGYLPGVRTLWASLQAVGTDRPMVVMVTDGVDADVRAVLEADGCTVRKVEPVRPPAGAGDAYVFEHFAEVWTKLAAWRLPYDRIVLVDADMLALQPMDELFTMPLPDHGIAAVHTCRCNPEHHERYPASWTPARCHWTYTHADAADPLPSDVDAYFNAGLVVLEPSGQVYDQLVERVAAIDDLGDYPFPEQDLLNVFYAGRWASLPWGFNGLKTHAVQHPRLWRLADVRLLHYLLRKPWQEADPDEPPVYGPLRELWDAAAARVVSDHAHPS